MTPPYSSLLKNHFYLWCLVISRSSLVLCLLWKRPSRSHLSLSSPQSAVPFTCVLNYDDSTASSAMKLKPYLEHIRFTLMYSFNCIAFHCSICFCDKFDLIWTSCFPPLMWRKGPLKLVFIITSIPLNCFKTPYLWSFGQHNYLAVIWKFDKW